jgi:hypothetical protein
VRVKLDECSTWNILGAGYEDRGGEGVAQQRWVEGSANADLPGTFKGKLLGEGEANAGPYALTGEIAEHLGIFVGDADDPGRLAGGELREGLEIFTGQGAVERWDGVAVRIEFRVAELCGDALFEPFGDEVLEAFCFLVDLVPWIAEDLVEEGLDETMVADDFEGALATGLGEFDAMVFAVDHHGGLGGGEFLEHVGDGGAGDGEMVCDLGAGYLALFASAEFEDGLEVVVHGFAAGALCFGWLENFKLQLIKFCFCHKESLDLA